MRLPATRGLVAVAATAACLLATLPAQAASQATPTASGTASASASSGRWTVRADGPGRWAVSWTSPSRLPMGSDRPTVRLSAGGADATVGVTTLDGDGRRVRALVSGARPSVGDLDVVLSGDRLDEPGDDLAAAAAATAARRTATPPSARREAAPGTLAGLPSDPGTPGSFEVTTSDYTLPSVKVAGLPEPVEMVGHVVEPTADAATGPRPLVLFLHGRHGVCFDPDDPEAYTDVWPCPAPLQEIQSQLGYDYVQRLLASQGFTTVSIRVNGINAQDYALDDGGADARAQVVRAHLDHWASIAAEHQVDLSRVVLVGHSRGGEGVDRAALQIPLSAPYRIVGQVLIAPTDFAAHTAPYIPTEVLLPACDGDVSDLQGQKFVDVARDPLRDDTALRSSVLVMGANHNFFNTEWTPGETTAPANDDWGGEADASCGTESPTRLTAAQQRAVGATYVAGAVRLFTGDGDLLPLLDGSRVSVPSIGGATVHVAAIGGGRDVRRPGADAGRSLTAGNARTSLCTGVATAETTSRTTCGLGLEWQAVPHWPTDGSPEEARTFLQMDWSRPGATGGLALERPLDLTGRRLELRTLVDPRVGYADLDVRIADGDGHSATLRPEGGELPALADGLTQLWGQALVVDTSGATGVDLADVTAVDLVARSSRGRVWVADVSSAPDALTPVPTRRAGLVSVGAVRVTEGDGSPSVRHLRVPVQISGLTRPARVVVQLYGARPGTNERFPLDLAPDQTEATITVPYESNRIDDESMLATQVSIWPVTGAATDRYVAQATVVDDDPTPRMTVRALGSRVTEGQPIVFELRAERTSRVLYDWNITVVAGRGTPLRGNDVPRPWLVERTEKADVHRSLASLGPYLSLYLEPGQRTARLEIPTRRDTLREGVEQVTVRFSRGSRVFTIPVQVRDAR